MPSLHYIVLGDLDVALVHGYADAVS
jgi:hypothetical protein